MVDISERVNKICTSLRNGKRVVVVAPRQSGKTTLMNFIIEALRNDCICINTTGQGLTYESHNDTKGFWSSYNNSIESRYRYYFESF